jgi:hypothetical protein
MSLVIENPKPIRFAVGDEVMRDARLSWADRGLYLMLAQTVNGTPVSKEILAENSISTPTEVDASFRRLKDCGYIVLEKLAGNNWIARLRQVNLRRPIQRRPVGEKDALQLRVEKLFRRRVETPMTPKEQKAYSAILPAIRAANEPDWLAMEKFYSAPQSQTYARKDLLTMLNNWNGEVERARAWSQSHDVAIGRVLTTRPTNGAGEAVFRAAGREFTLANPPKLSDFSTAGEYETYMSAYESWRRTQS